MTASQIIACAIAWTAAIVACTAYVLVRRRARRENTVRYQLQHPFRGGVLTTEKPLTEAEFDALRAKLEREYAQYCGGRAVPVVDVTEEEPGTCSHYQPPAKPEDSGYCARCGMFDYKHPRTTHA